MEARSIALNPEEGMRSVWQNKTVKLVLTSLLVLTATVYAARATVSIVGFKVGGLMG